MITNVLLFLLIILIGLIAFSIFRYTSFMDCQDTEWIDIRNKNDVIIRVKIDNIEGFIFNDKTKEIIVCFNVNAGINENNCLYFKYNDEEEYYREKEMYYDIL